MIALLLIITLSLCSGICFAQDYGDALVSGSIADARTLVPILASDSSSSDVCGMLFNGLIKYDKEINLIGDLAQSWEIQHDGLSIIFHLREGISWHDGKPFTAKDVEFTYQKLIDPLVRTPYSGDFQKIKSLEVINDYTVKITYKEPFSPALASWAMPIMPKHLLEKENLNSTAFSRHPVGSGPYRFKAWKAQEKIELTANKEYFEKAPYISRSIYRVIPDEATLFLELQAQGVDSSGLTPLQYRKLSETNFFKQNYRKFRLESFSYTYLGFNLNNPLFKDKRIRQALNYAIDKNEIISGVLLGLGRITTGPFVPESWAYNHNIRPLEFSPQKAKELLAECGWLDHDKDGWLDKEGMGFEFTIITNQGNLERQRVGEIIQARLAALGIKVKLKVVEWSVFLSEFIDKRHFEAVLLGWALGREPDNYDIWHSSKMKEGEFNFIGYSNPEVDRLLDEARKTFEQNKRKEAYHRIQEIIYEEQPCVFLYVPDALPIISSRFEGIQPAPIGIGYNFIQWWVPKSKQKYKSVIQQ
ncbi:MAG: peptide-binding protein [Omnitrophica WOR_2 bacterium RIFCSPHIGHO2_02_FULL_45_21]|nr:MAG: peptide-binding protein [Omnitrophica WOR_2 bacterium RIFCSPHIGHO2_02_FULL_45_21]